MGKVAIVAVFGGFGWLSGCLKTVCRNWRHGLYADHVTRVLIHIFRLLVKPFFFTKKAL